MWFSTNVVDLFSIMFMFSLDVEKGEKTPYDSWHLKPLECIIHVT